MKKIKIICLIGEAGSGKDTIMKRVLAARQERLHEIVSCTTRPPREGEVDGVNYHFYSPEQFRQKIEDGEMLESTCFNSWFYGTGLDSLDKNKINIGVFNPAGIRSLEKNPNVETYVFWVKTDEKTRLIRQLEREKNPNVSEIVRRYSTDKEDFKNIDFAYKEIYNENRTDIIIATFEIINFLDDLI
jgi:guanylate kinase